uniref:Obscurin-like protein 1 n=1 Tax=Poecilia mexicana TaxID=48701 RepID=A0A3B3XZG2_9TELE
MDILGGAPRVLGYPRPVVAQFGADATLRCQIGGDPHPDVIWERKNIQILSEGRYKISEEGKAYLLTITGVTQQDAGQYICKARNSVGETYAAASLKVEGENQANDQQKEIDLTSNDKPRFLIKPLSLRVDRGEDAAFSCKIWGTPLPEVTWEKDGKKLNDIFENSHFSVSIQDGGWFQLKIYRTRMPDKGVYTCKAVNSYGEALAGAVLLVESIPEREDSGRFSLSKLAEEPPIIPSKVKKFVVTEGKHAKFRCFVTGKPKPEIIWKKDGVPLEPDRRHLVFEDREGYYTLKVLYCKMQDTGLYVCAASNTLGNTLSAVHLTVKGPAVRFRRTLKDVEAKERDVAVLECEVPDETIPAAWYLEDQRLMPSSKYGMEQKGTRRRLTIHDVGMDDDGVYLCEMPDGAKSIAELAVKGTIVRKLPRKLEVLEGENAVFCVEVENDEMEVHWFKDGLMLHETHQTILKAFGKTHILVFVNVAYHDSGIVTFVAGRSKSSSRLKVKATRHSPPICPVGVKVDIDRPNSALFSWVPAPNSQTTTRSMFVLERKEIGSQEWQKCFTSETVTSAEVSGDSVPCEGDYRFRVCCINKYGRSGHVEFPKVVHLVPGPKIHKHLQGCEVMEGEDAQFSIELSAPMVGTWFLNSSQLQDGGRYSVQLNQTKHSLVIHEAGTADDTAEITFIFIPLSDLESSKRVETGDTIVLYCEVTHPFAKVTWFKNGEKLQVNDGLNIQSDGKMRRIVIQSAEASHSGVYTSVTIHPLISCCSGPPVEFSPASQEELHKNSVEGTMRRLIIRSAEASDTGHYTCKSGNNSLEFTVSVREPPVTIVEPKDDIVMTCYISEEIHLQCELSRSNGKVCWFKDGQEVQESDNIQLRSEGPYRRLTILCGSAVDSGEYVCETDGDSVFFQITVTEPPVRIISPCEPEVELTHVAPERLELCCEVSQADAPVRWYKDSLEVEESPNLILEVDGAQRRLVIPLTTVSDKGEYICDTENDSVAFLVNITEPPVMLSQPKNLPDKLESLAGKPIVLEVEVSRLTADVKWLLNDKEIEQSSNITITEDGIFRRLTINSPTPNNSGKYTCDATDDKIDFQVKVSEPPVTFVNKEDDVVVTGYEAESVTLMSYVSKESAVVRWLKDWTPVEGERFRELMDGHKRSLTIQPLRRSDAGEYTCDQLHSLPTLSSVPRVVEFLTELHNTTVLEGEDATFKCVVSPENVSLLWLMDNEPMTLGDRFQVSQNGLCHTLVIKKCQMIDCSRITLNASFSFVSPHNVLEAQVMFTKKMEPVTAEEFGEATLETEISLETGEVQWMRQGVVIQSGPRHTLAQNGCKRSLTIHNLNLSDRGTYRCETLHDRTQVKLNVERK